MQLSTGEVLLLAVVQGITEFLPISSSGHLVIFAAALSPNGTTKGLNVADVNIVLHAGTLLSILVYYWRRIWRLLREDHRSIGVLIVATLPAVVVGLPIKILGEAVLENTLLAGAMLVATGAILLWAARLPVGQQPYAALPYGQALLIGLAQAVAILPGVSRSGATISTGIAVGMTRNEAASFSFLMAVPAIAGAALLEIIEMTTHHSPSATPRSTLALGAAVSFAVGLGALAWLVRWLERGRLQYFAYWCIPVGLLVIGWQLSVRSG